MESWTFDSKAKMGSLDWESKSPFIFENNMVFSNNAMCVENQGFGEICFPQIVGNSLSSPIMGATHNKFLEEHESSSELLSSVVESNQLLDLTTHVASKQKRTMVFNSLSPLCKVHGCNKSLVSCKDYHKRHKVCELHSKTAKVIVHGVEQRFCQQCSRFHLLKEFDDGKRSCRKRLADHNERRRKPHSSRHGRLLPPYHPTGTKVKGSTKTRARSSIIDIDQYPSLYVDNNEYIQASNSHLFPFLNKDQSGGEEDFITMDSTCALSPLSSQSHGSSSFHLSRNPTSWTHALNQNTHLASGVLNNMNPLMVGSEYVNSQNRLWCDEVSTVDLLHLSSQLERVELHK
ncbi:hypothetical protein Lser_V15G18501 [Lactuca serriola]